MVQKRTTQTPDAARRAQLRELAEHISAILSNPSTPDILADHLLNGIAAIDDSVDVNQNPNYVEAILLTHYETEGDGR